jgi:DNA repair exonuclease SbcCD nuclease subunit
MIKKSKVAIFSDLHLGVHGNSEDWHRIGLEWCDWIVEELTNNKIKDIFFLGDFFDNRSEISVQTLHIASEILNKLKPFNIIMVVGNHDAFYKNRSDIHSLGLMNGYENIHIVDKNLTFEKFDKNFAFVPWHNELPDGKFDYILGHFEIQSFKMNNFKVCDKGLQVIDLLGTKTDTVFSGHFHRRSTGKYNEGSIHYVGNTFPMDFADVDNSKGYHILDVESGKLSFIENLVSPKFNKILLSKIKSITEDKIKNNFVKLVIDLSVDDKQMEKIKTYINKFSPFRLVIEHNTSTNTIDNVEEIDSINIVDMFDEFIVGLDLEEEQNERVEKYIKELFYLLNR